MIYFIEALGTGMVKVGYAVDVAKRLQHLQCASPLKLQFIDYIPGSRADESMAHRALGKQAVGEWFPRKEALDLLRAVRRTGLSACTHFTRWRENERRVRAWRLRFNKKAADLTARRICQHTLETVPHEDMVRVTGATIKTWKRGAQGQTVPSLQHLFNSLQREPRFLSNLTWAVSRQVMVRQPRETCQLADLIRPILSELGAIVEEADRIKGAAA